MANPSSQRLEAATSGGMLDRMFGLRDRVAVVTGGGGGIGREIALLFANVGAHVVIADINLGAATRTASDIAALGGQARAFHCDTTDEASVKSLFAQVSEILGGTDILVNNAGIYPVMPLLETDVSDWDQVQNVNLRGCFLCVREAVRQMRPQKAGRIINISSIASVHPVLNGYAAYAASKGGLNAFTRTVAFEVAEHGITVNALLIGGVTADGGALSSRGVLKGPATQAGRCPLGPVTPTKHAQVALFLASEASSHMTGQMVVADCGFLLS